MTKYQIEYTLQDGGLFSYAYHYFRPEKKTIYFIEIFKFLRKLFEGKGSDPKTFLEKNGNLFSFAKDKEYGYDFSFPVYEGITRKDVLIAGPEYVILGAEKMGFFKFYNTIINHKKGTNKERAVLFKICTELLPIFYKFLTTPLEELKKYKNKEETVQLFEIVAFYILPITWIILSGTLGNGDRGFKSKFQDGKGFWDTATKFTDERTQDNYLDTLTDALKLPDKYKYKEVIYDFSKGFKGSKYEDIQLFYNNKAKGVAEFFIPKKFHK